MNYKWTNHDIEQILLQLDRENYPFNNYVLAQDEEGLELIGTGGFSHVYRALNRRKSKKTYALKAIGFGEHISDSEKFYEEMWVQKKLSEDTNVIRIVDYTEIIVWIEGEHTVVKTMEYDAIDNMDTLEGNYLHLQFVLMEELLPIICDRPQGGKELRVAGLARFDEKEIIKLAFDIGEALNTAHSKGMIHRDVKLENVFYEQPYGMSEGRYKLGDFGIATATSSGFAGTVAYTKGYGAPEVVYASDDKYDNTADIYSFGMMIYVLLNHLRFPNSRSYNSNVALQYSTGYVPPDPKSGQEQLVNIVLKMCSFNPDDRYQSMEDVLNELDAIRMGYLMKTTREHNKSTLYVGVIAMIAGVVLCKLSFGIDMGANFDIWMYILLGLFIADAVVGTFKEKAVLFKIGAFILGICMMAWGGFTWYNLVIWILLILGRYMSAAVSVGVLIAHFIGLLGGAYLVESPNAGWISISLISISFFLLIRYDWIKHRTYMTMIGLYGYWGLPALYCVALILIDYLAANNRLWSFGDAWNQFFSGIHIGNVALSCLLFFAFWAIRELVLMWIDSGRSRIGIG